MNNKGPNPFFQLQRNIDGRSKYKEILNNNNDIDINVFIDDDKMSPFEDEFYTSASSSTNKNEFKSNSLLNENHQSSGITWSNEYIYHPDSNSTNSYILTPPTVLVDTNIIKKLTGEDIYELIDNNGDWVFNIEAIADVVTDEYLNKHRYNPYNPIAVVNNYKQIRKKLFHNDKPISSQNYDDLLRVKNYLMINEEENSNLIEEGNKCSLALIIEEYINDLTVLITIDCDNKEMFRKLGKQENELLSNIKLGISVKTNVEFNFWNEYEFLYDIIIKRNIKIHKKIHQSCIERN